MNRIYKNIRLRYIFILIVVLLLIVLIAIQSTYTMTQVSSLVSSQVSEASVANLNQVTARIEERLEDYKSIANTVLINFDIIDQISDMDSLTLLEEIGVHEVVEDYIQNLKNARLDIAEILIVVENTKVDNYQQSGLISRALLEEQKMYSYMTDATYGFIPTGEHLMEVGNHQEVFSYFIKGYTKGTGEFIVIISIYEEKLNEILKDTDTNTILFLSNGRGEIIAPYEPMYKELASDITNEKLEMNNYYKYSSLRYEDDDYLYIENTIDDVWRVVQMQNLAELGEGLDRINQKLIIVIALCMVFGIVYINYMVKGVTKPIQKLILQMKKVGRGDFDIDLDHSYNNEIGELNDQFEETVKEIDYLMNKMGEDNIKLRISELKALQMQINPHFLYNTLNAINWMALNHSAEDISSMALDLSQLFRLSLNSGRETTTVGYEIEHLKSYIRIQSYRYNNSFECIYDIDEGVSNYSTIKIILQPFVENALIHGFKKTRGMGIIRIAASIKDKSIVYRISDDGCGVNHEILNDLLIHQQENQNSYGIKNVNDRIKIYYGDAYGVRYLEVAKGTSVEIIIPKSKSEVTKDV